MPPSDFPQVPPQERPNNSPSDFPQTAGHVDETHNSTVSRDHEIRGCIQGLKRKGGQGWHFSAIPPWRSSATLFAPPPWSKYATPPWRSSARGWREKSPAARGFPQVNFSASYQGTKKSRRVTGGVNSKERFTIKSRFTSKNDNERFESKTTNNSFRAGS